MSGRNIEDVSNGEVKLDVSTDLYSRDAILEATYKFTDRCYIELSPSGKKTMHVHFIAKQDGINLNTIAKDFQNELIDQQLRHRIRCETQEIQKTIIKEAFAPLDNVPKLNHQEPGA